MTHRMKLEEALELLISEDTNKAAEILHQIIVEKARQIYESIVDEEDDNIVDEPKDENDSDEGDEVGGEEDKDFTDEISDDQDEIDSDEENDGEADDEFAGDEAPEGDVEERVEDLETQLADLRAEFDALMGEEMQEPNHADLGDEFADEDDFGDQDDIEHDDAVDGPDLSGNEQVVGEVVATMYEKKKMAALKKAPEAKKGELKKGAKKVDEETKFLHAVADTGQKGTAKLVGTGKGTPLGAEQTKSSFTNIPARKDYGGKPAKIGGGTGGEYGKYNGETAQNKTPSDNVNVKAKSVSDKADTTAKFTGGKSAGEGQNKSPLSKRPGQ